MCPIVLFPLALPPTFRGVSPVDTSPVPVAHRSGFGTLGRGVLLQESSPSPADEPSDPSECRQVASPPLVARREAWPWREPGKQFRRGGHGGRGLREETAVGPEARAGILLVAKAQVCQAPHDGRSPQALGSGQGRQLCGETKEQGPAAWTPASDCHSLKSVRPEGLEGPHEGLGAGARNQPPAGWEEAESREWL